MTESDTGLVGLDGKPIKTHNIPVVKFRDFIFSVELLQKEDVAHPVDGGFRPGDIVKEYRSRCTELEDRVQILTAILCTVIQEGPEAGREFLNSVGAKVVDLNNKVLFEPKKNEDS